ncbi:MAG: PspC domain-containing protein [Vicinamibacterales bacterium]
MACPRCNRDVPSDGRYCPACGAPLEALTPPSGSTRRLTRLPAEAKIAGVCAGIADYLAVDVTLVRALWLVLSIVPGALIGGIVAYVLAWVVMPEGTPVGSHTGHRLVRSATDAKIAGVCGGLAEYFAIDSTPIRVVWIVLSVVPGCVLGGILAYLAAWLIVPRAPSAVLKPSATHAA